MTMTDEYAIAYECAIAQQEGREITDGCARTIASQWYSTNAGASFVTTGAIVCEPSTLWRELGGAEYPGASTEDRVALDMLGTYLVAAGERGPVAGWSQQWAGRGAPADPFAGIPVPDDKPF